MNNNPLETIHTELSNGKMLTPFDKVLLLKGTAQNDFEAACENVDINIRSKPTARAPQKAGAGAFRMPKP